MATRSNRIHSNDWIILRTSGSKTLRLAETLTGEGYEAWTPTETRSIRIPRANVRRTVTLPIMPTYVFARAAHLIDLLDLAKASVGRNGFSVLMVHDKFPMVEDASLDGLRYIEQKRTPRKKAREALSRGMPVGVEGGSFGGLKGIVERSDTIHTVVCFNDKLVVKLRTSLFERNDVGELTALMGLAAQRKAA